MRRKEVLAALGISHSTLYAWIRAGRFPQPIPLGENTSGWLEQDVRDFIAERAKQRDLFEEHV
jgi:prophage regulatory protein